MSQKFTKVILLAMFMATMQLANAQFCYDQDGCSNYANFGYNSENFEDGTGNAAAALEYDNIVSGDRATIVRNLDGSFRIWGQHAASSGNAHLLSPQIINAANYPGLTGTPLKATIGSRSENAGASSTQFFLLTSDNKLWVWGKAGAVLSASLTTNTSGSVQFQQLALGLPSGVTAANVRMMFAAGEVFAITTCNGDVWVIAQDQALRGNPSSSETVWTRVLKADNTPLTNVVATRGSGRGLFALDASGNIWTWGRFTYSGGGGFSAYQPQASQMTLPSATGRIKMIGSSTNFPGGATGNATGNTYYVLYEDGRLFSVGHNHGRQVGHWDATYSIVYWQQPKYPNATGNAAGANMTDIAWISPQEHEVDGNASINVINTSKVLWNWGQTTDYMIGAPYSFVGFNATYPRQPQFATGYTNTDIIAVESGGSSTLLFKGCVGNLGFAGLRSNGAVGDGSTASDFFQPITFTGTPAIQLCGIIPAAPVVNAAVSNDCESATPNAINLNKQAHIGTIPSGTILQWWTTATRDAGTQVLSPTTVGNGTYYAFYQNTDGCYGPPSLAVTVTIASCHCVITAANPDSDGDGIADDCDMDDDNDGILDTQECSNTINDMFAVYGAGDLLSIVPSDFGLALNARNQNVAADLSAKFGYPANSGAVIVSITNASVHPGTDAWWTKNGEAPSVWNVTGSLSAFVLMSQNDEYYGNDSKTIHIFDDASVIPITVPGMANQTPVPGVWGVTETASAKTLAKLDGAHNPLSSPEGDWRYANMNFGPKSFGFSTTTAFAEPTYAVNLYLECDVDGDGIPNRLDLDSDNDDCLDALEGSAAFEYSNLQDAGGTVTVGAGSAALVKNLCGDNQCIDANGVPDIAASGQASVETYNENEISIVCSDALPVKLVEFNASKEDNSVQTKWSTTEESNSDYFEVQHSTDAKSWKALGAVRSHGESTIKRNYDYTHTSPVKGMNYYRLKMVDLDGTFAHSSIVSVRMNEGTNQPYIFPNPASGVIKLNEVNLEKVAKVELMNVDGKVLYKANKIPAEGIDVKGLVSKGLYMLKVSHTDGSQSIHKVVITD